MRDAAYHNSQRGKKGHEAEAAAYEYLQKHYNSVQKFEDRDHQIHYGDFYTKKLGYIEFKDEKQISTSDKSYNSDVLIIEFVNNYGYKGWLYKTHTNFFMFKVGKRYLFVKKESLIKKAEELCKNIDNPIKFKFSNGKTKLPYQCYQRWDTRNNKWRKDSCAYIRVSDIRSLEKDKDYWFENMDKPIKEYEEPAELL